MKRKHVLRSAVLSLSALCAGWMSQANAHPLWVLPSEFNISGEDSTWITFDASASHSVFGFDKGVGLDRAQIFTPDGERSRLNSYFKGKRRSVFDLNLEQDGTYKVFVQRPVSYFTSYKAGKREKEKFVRANKLEAPAKLPEDARDVQTMLYDMNSVTYVTRNKPTDTVYKIKGKGFELKHVTHPNDIAQGEEVIIEAMMDGKPVAGVEVEITPGGSQYRDDRNSIEIETDDTGRIAFTPNQPGPWLLGASTSYPANTVMADEVKVVRYVTFEVIPE